MLIQDQFGIFQNLQMSSVAQTNFLVVTYFCHFLQQTVSKNYRLRNIDVHLSAFFLQFNFITFFQACLIAFTSEFIPKLVYKYEHSWEMKGYVNFTLATSPHQGWGEVGKTECRYRAFRDHEGSFTPSHYKILGLKLAFVIIFEVSTNDFFTPNVCKKCQMQHF